MNKPNILMMPHFYPTKESPINGSFFKEQARVLSANFNFVVLLYNKHDVGLKRFLINFSRNKIFSFLVDKSDMQLPELYADVFFISNHGLIKKILFKLGISKIINQSIQKNFLTKLQQNLARNFNFSPDILYAMTSQLFAVYARNIACHFNIPYVLSEHCPFPLAGTFISAETKNAIESADLNLSISIDKTRQMLIQGIEFEPVLIGNMVDEDLFTIYENEKIDDVFTIIIVASYNYCKDYDTFFKAIKMLRENTTRKIKLLLVGFSPTAQNEWALGTDNFKALVEKYALTCISEFYPCVKRSDMPNLYNKANVFVMSSIQEGFPVSSLEATSCGLPVVSTRCGGVEDFIDSENGRLVNIRDYIALSNELLNILDGKIKFDKYTIREKTVRLYGKNAFRERVSNSFYKILNEKKGNILLK